MALHNWSRTDALRLLITLTLFGLILWWIEPRKLVAELTNVLWFWVIVRIAPYAASIWIQALRWKIFLGIEDIRTETGRLFRRVWMSRFFANLLPGSIGGDIFRVIESGDFSSSRMAVARSVLLDRVVALVSLGLYTSIACLLWAWRNTWPSLGWLAVVGLIGSIFVLLLLATEVPGRIMRWSAKKLSAGRIQTFFFQLTKSLNDLSGRPCLLLGAALLTFLFNVTWAIGSYFGFLALDQTISPLLVILLIPVIYAVSALPISVNGLGVTEGIFVLVFTASGLQPAEAAAVAILLRITGILMSGFGGLLYLFETRRSGRTTAQ